MYERDESKIKILTEEFQSICENDEKIISLNLSMVYFLFIKENVLKRQKVFNFVHVIVFFDHI